MRTRRRSTLATTKALLPLLLMLLGSSSSSPSSAQPQPASGSLPPSQKPAAGELATLPADTLAAWVVDLTWLVEQQAADLRLADVERRRQVDSLARRLEWAEERLRWAAEDKPHWLVQWLLPLAVTAGVVVGAAAAQ